eukprot:12972949-Alexandrium_andersonii.AAC.1
MVTSASRVTNHKWPAIRLADATSQIPPEASRSFLASPRGSAMRAALRCFDVETRAASNRSG